MQRRDWQFVRRYVLAIAVGVLGLARSAAAAPVSGQGTWETTLKARDVNGSPVALNSDNAVFFYDTALNITWLGDWNVNGRQTWSNQMAWAAGLTVGAFSGWRLPFILDTGPTGCEESYGGITDCGFNVQTKSGSTVFSELAHMWYETLGNLAYCPPGDNTTCSGPAWDSQGEPQAGWGLSNTGPFKIPQDPFAWYWSGTSFAPIADAFAWDFILNSGFQGFDEKERWGLYAVAVRDGDVVQTPEPSVYALLLVGLGLLGLLARRRPR